MSRWLTCALCNQRKPVGVMSAQAWGALKAGSLIAHACPECQAKREDWRDELTRLLRRATETA